MVNPIIQNQESAAVNRLLTQGTAKNVATGRNTTLGARFVVVRKSFLQAAAVTVNLMIRNWKSAVVKRSLTHRKVKNVAMDKSTTQTPTSAAIMILSLKAIAVMVSPTPLKRRSAAENRSSTYSTVRNVAMDKNTTGNPTFAVDIKSSLMATAAMANILIQNRKSAVTTTSSVQSMGQIVVTV